MIPRFNYKHDALNHHIKEEDGGKTITVQENLNFYLIFTDKTSSRIKTKCGNKKQDKKNHRAEEIFRRMLCYRFQTKRIDNTAEIMSMETASMAHKDILMEVP